MREIQPVLGRLGEVEDSPCPDRVTSEVSANRGPGANTEGDVGEDEAHFQDFVENLRPPVEVDVPSEFRPRSEY